jgi:hypothetical protein
MNPLRHYVLHGVDRARFPSKIFDQERSRFSDALDLSLLDIPKTFDPNNSKTAILLHIHYPEVLHDILPLLNLYPAHCILFRFARAYDLAERDAHGPHRLRGFSVFQRLFDADNKILAIGLEPPQHSIDIDFGLAIERIGGHCCVRNNVATPVADGA